VTDNAGRGARRLQSSTNRTPEVRENFRLSLSSFPQSGWPILRLTLHSLAWVSPSADAPSFFISSAWERLQIILVILRRCWAPRRLFRIAVTMDILLFLSLTESAMQPKQTTNSHSPGSAPASEEQNAKSLFLLGGSVARKCPAIFPGLRTDAAQCRSTGVPWI